MTETKKEIDLSMLVESIANLTNLVTELTARVTKLEQTNSVDGVYLDGVPDYVRMYVSEPKREE